MSELERTVVELEGAAEELRSGELAPEEAAVLVERCAELAAQVAGSLEAEARAARSDAPGQERLL